MQVNRVPWPISKEAREIQERILAFLDSTLRPNVNYSIRQEYPSVYGEYPGGESFYIEEDGKVVSHSASLVREFRYGKYTFRVGLIGSVVTASRYRGRGMAKAILTRISDEARKKGCLVAVLWSDKPEFYQPLGFFRSGREMDFRFCSDNVPAVEERVEEYNPEIHSHLLWRLYQRHDVRVDRSLEEQKNLCRIPRARIFLTREGEKATSYLAIHKGMDFENYIHEWGGDIVQLQKNIAYVQKRFFENENLTMIAPAHYDLGPIRQIADSHWEGALGLIKVLDRARLLAFYMGFLEGQGVPCFHDRNKGVIVISETPYDVSTEQHFVKLVFGDDTPSAKGCPQFPFFLWGFDSI